jgi:RHS repeat-associated protein
MGLIQFCAYGTIRAGNTADLKSDRTFTGQKQDGTGLLYYNARYYDPALGTFISPDTLVPDPGLVLDYNRYMYAGGNPLRYTDPSGHCRFDSNGDWQFAIDCSLDEFNALSWDWRMRWMQDFAATYTNGRYFDNILGIIEYFQGDSVFSNSAWAKLSDAGVLLAIQDGQRLVEGNSPMGNYAGFMAAGNADPATAWGSFFRTVGSTQGANLALWGTAEQLGVDYGTFLANPLLIEGTKESIYAETFVAWGNVYRGVVISGAPGTFAPENCASGFYCQAWTTPSYFFHPSHSRGFVREFSRNVISPAALRAYARSLTPSWAPSPYYR